MKQRILLMIIGVFLGLFLVDVMYGLFIPRTIVMDDYLGWRVNDRYQYTGQRQRQDKTEWIDVSFYPNGWRMVGDGGYPRILFIGDSFTHAVEADDKATYYRLLSERLDARVYAIGVRGYGNLQEYLLLDSVLNEVDPDIIVWQLCDNDFVENTWDLIHANGQHYFRRPYLEEKDIVYRGWPSWPYRSTLAAYWLPRWLVSDTVFDGYTPEAKEITGDVFSMVADRVNGIPVLTFSCRRRFESEWDSLSTQNGFVFLYEISPPRDVNHRHCFDGQGYHWSHAGHQFVAEQLFESLQSLLDSVSR